MNKIRVIVVDDHEVVRLGLKMALDHQEDIEVVGAFSDAAEAVRQTEALTPDVVLMDVRLPGMDGIQACRLIKERAAGANVLMLTSFSDDQAVIASILAGAAGYLLKNAGSVELVTAVRAAAKGESLLDPAVAAKVLAHLRALSQKQQAHDQEQLSPLETDVLVLVAQGLTNREIAGRLIISEQAAGLHIDSILEKLGLTERSDAAAYLAERRLPSAERPSIPPAPPSPPRPSPEQGPTQQPSPPPTGPASAQPSSGRVYEGPVVLDIKVGGKMDLAISFVGNVRKTADFRFLRMVNKHDGVEISVSLRQPLSIEEALAGFPEVSRVALASDQADKEPRFVVLLGPKETAAGRN